MGSRLNCPSHFLDVLPVNDELINESPVIGQAFSAPPPPQPEIVVLPPVVPGKPGWDAKVYHFIRNLLTMMVIKGVWRVVGHLSVKIVRWVFDWSWRGYQLVRWRLSRRVGVDAFAKRQQACSSCNESVQVGFKRYCRACNCPRWRCSELTIKNQRVGHNCPLGLHDGSYRTSGGCSTCGGGPKTNGKQTAPQARR